MTTATEPKSSAAELRKLTQKRDQLHAKAREARDRRDEYDAETKRMQAELSARTVRWTPGVPRPEELPADDEAERLKAEIKKRTTEPNPHEAEYAEARAAFHAADEAAADYARSTISERVREVQDVYAAQETMREGFELIVRGAEAYRVCREEVRTIVTETAQFDGQDYAYDPRVDEWYEAARSALDADLLPPGLSDLGQWKAEQV
jgi:chromosome segregation ATPase